MIIRALKAPKTATRIIARKALTYQESDKDQIDRLVGQTIRYQPRATGDLKKVKTRIVAIRHVIKTGEVYAPLSNYPASAK